MERRSSAQYASYNAVLGGGPLLNPPTDLRVLGTAVGAPGSDVFASGVVRKSAMNRVASTDGEGAMMVRLAHEYLAMS